MQRALLVAVLALPACFDELTCDSSAASSVTVSVVDSGGSLVGADDVTYSVDGSGEVSCDPLDDIGAEYVCGWEETGSFVITVYYGGDVYTRNIDVELRADGCHVDSQFIDVVVS